MTLRSVGIGLLALAMVATLVAPATVAVVGAQQANNTTATPTATPTATATPDAASDGEYTISELRESGTRPANAPASVRYFPDGSGAVAVRYEPAAPLQDGMTFLPERTMLNTDDIQFYTTRFGGREPSEYTVHVVFWQPETVTVQGENGSSRQTTVATNQRERTFTFAAGYGYDTSNITLPSHYEQPFHATMWLTQDGERVEGARWTFRHQTVQSEQGVAIDSRGDLWWWAGKNIFLILIPGLLGSAVGVKGVIRKTGRGPDKSATWWGLFVILPLVGLVATVGYFETAQLAARAPQVFGVFAVLIGAIAMLETMGRERRTDEFVRDEFDQAEAPMSDRLPNRLYRDKARVHTVPRDDGLGLIKPGIRPFLARLLADPAVIQRSDLETDIQINRGPDDFTFIADPDSDTPLDWTPAHFAFDWSLLRPVAEDSDGGWRTIPDRIRWGMLAAPALGATVGLYAGRYLFDAGSGFAIAGAAVAFALAALEARDGVADFQPADIHYRNARPSIISLKINWKDAKTIRELRERNSHLLGMTAQEAKEISRKRDQTLSESLAEDELGLDMQQLRRPGAADDPPARDEPADGPTAEGAGVIERLEEVDDDDE